MAMHHRNKSVDVHQFAMVPRAEIPRASFNIQKAYKTTFDSGWLIPVFCEEVLPGDSFRVKMTAFARLATPLFPIMDNLYMESFFFFVPNRLTWDHWRQFMGQQDDLGASTSYLVPHVVVPPGGVAVSSIGDYFGLPTVGGPNVADAIQVNSLPLRGYNLIFNEWFRDQNLVAAAPVNRGDGPDDQSAYVLRRRGKRHDYFTSCLPWPQKGTSVPISVGGLAPVKTGAVHSVAGSTGPQTFATTFNTWPNSHTVGIGAQGVLTTSDVPISGPQQSLIPNNLWADLSQATAATINQLRQSFQIQKLLERDARGGTRYTEIVRSHFGVVSPDARLQRPEYLGGGSTPITISPIAQTSATGVSGGTSPQGNLSAIGTMLARGHGFSQSFTEHGYVIGLVNVRADLTYQQGVRKMWLRSTRYDFYFPAFAMLGEQAVLNREIFYSGVGATDNAVFGYQERWAEYRYSPSQLTGLFRSTSAGTLDAWHLAQRFATPPVLGQTFIEENPPLERVLAVGAAANGQQLLFDSFFDMRVARPMPLYSVPGLIDHF